MTRKRGTGTIRVRTLKSGELRYDVLVPDKTAKGGKRLLEVCEDEVQAHAVLAAWMVERAQHGHFVPRDQDIVTVRQLGHLYLKTLSEQRRKDERSRWSARIDTAEFADWPVTQLSERSVRRWLRDQAQTPIATGKSAGELPTRQTLQNALNLLRAGLGYAVKHEILDRNVAHGVTVGDSTIHRPRSTRAGDGYEYAYEPEVRRLLDAELEDATRTGFVLVAFTGARPMDVYLLTWDRVDVHGKTIRYWSHKRRRDYVVHMLPTAHEQLRKWWMASGRPSEGLVFPGPKGQPHARGYDWGWVGGYNRDGTQRQGVRERIGIRRKLPLYSLRHTCACHLLLGTELFTGGRAWTLEEIASQLGHTDLSTVRRYAVALGLASKRAAEESRAMIKHNRQARR